jgi:hypothetical protein
LRAQVTVEVDIATIAEGSDARATFEAGFSEDVSQLLTNASATNVTADRVRVESIESGSVVVTFAVLPADDGSFVPTSALATAFESPVTVGGYSTDADAGLLITDSPPMGCTDVTAINYRSWALEDDGSCIAPRPGCNDTFALNYNTSANVDDGSCESDPCHNATLNTCALPAEGGTCTPYNSSAFACGCGPGYIGNGTWCGLLGCTDAAAMNYEPAAQVDDETAISESSSSSARLSER